MATNPTTPDLKSFVSTRLLLTRMNDEQAVDALAFLGADADAAAPADEPAELAAA